MAKYKAIVFSPGPGRPEQVPLMKEVIEQYKGVIPVLGVCLGHQAIGEYFGMELVNATRIMHGKISEISHDSQGLYAGLPDKIKVVRYHSLILKPESLPEELVVTAQTATGEIMGLRHRRYLIESVQYHPESILTTTGKRQLANFLKLVEEHRSGNHVS